MKQKLDPKIIKPSWHIFIIWNESLYKKNEIIDDIKNKFLIKEVFEISWNPSLFVENLKRFYGATLPDPLEKAKICGFGPFLVILVVDLHPRYDKRGVIRKQVVNTNVFDSKMQYREWLGGAFRIHGSNTEKETEHNLALLLGKNLNDVINSASPKWDNKIKKIKRDLSGYDNWNDLSELFYILNATTNYVVLRNFEGFPDDISKGNHKDIDMLTDDLWQIPYIVNKKIRMDDEHGPSSYVKIMNLKIKIDFKTPGDNYFDKNWEKNILKKKVKSEQGFYIPDLENYFYSLLYHMLIHKGKLSEDYLKRLQELAVKLKINANFSLSDSDSLKQLLDKFMKKNGYRYTNSFVYKLVHNEFTRMGRSAILVGRKQGLSKLIRSGRDKLYRRRLVKSGKV